MTGIVIVAGGFGALGRTVVATLIERGYRIAAVDMAPAPADHPATLALGGIDLADEGAVKAAYATIVDAFGPIAALVNVAGGFLWEPVVGGSADSWERMYRINLATTVTSCRAVVPHIVSGAAIVNVGAAAANAPGVGMAPYAASKAGVRVLTESLAEELRGRAVRVNAVLPTIIDTPANRIDMAGADRANWVCAADVARVIAFLISEDAAAVTGASIPLSMGRPV